MKSVHEHENNALSEHVNPAALRRLAGSRSFYRGERYFQEGRVRSLEASNSSLQAKVSGTHRYRVEMKLEDDELVYRCSCPMGDGGAFCKHLVAAGLAWLAQPSSSLVEQALPKTKRPISKKDVRQWLSQQEKSTLVDLLMEQASENDDLYEALRARAAKNTGHLADLLETVDRTFDPGDFINYHEAWDYARRAERLIAVIRSVLKDGHPEDAVQLAERALKAIERALEHMDDSNGEASPLMDALMEIHLQACRKASIDPKALARRLFEWEMATEWDTFFGAVERYKSVLGKEGLAFYRELAEKEWAGVKKLGPGDRDQSLYGRRFRITSIMESLARLSGSLDRQIEVKSRNLSSAYDFLKIAETCRQAREHDRAMEWAEKGVKAFPRQTDSRLREFLASEYHRRKRHDDAMQMLWLNFLDHPCLEDYSKLKVGAAKAKAWESWRARAIEEVRRHIVPRESPKPLFSGNPWAHDRTDASLLVQILLSETDVEAAWKEAVAGGCEMHLWLELARQREAQHPDGAAVIYQQHAEFLVEQKNNSSYRESIDFISRARDLLYQSGRMDDFQTWLLGMKTRHKAKRNFIKFLEAKRWR